MTFENFRFWFYCFIRPFFFLLHQCCNKIETWSNPMKHFALFFIPVRLRLNSRLFFWIIEYCFTLQIISSNTNCYVMLKENKCCGHIDPQKLITLTFPRFNLTFATKQIFYHENKCTICTTSSDISVCSGILHNLY